MQNQDRPRSDEFFAQHWRNSSVRWWIGARGALIAAIYVFFVMLGIDLVVYAMGLKFNSIFNLFFHSFLTVLLSITISILCHKLKKWLQADFRTTRVYELFWKTTEK
jgi:hypothetical protein